MKHAYLILAHNQFEVLRHLINAIDDARNDIYIHFDNKLADIPVFKTKYSKLVVIDNRVNVYWADVSMAEAELNLFSAASKSGDYSYYHLLSGVDMPLKSQNYIHDFFKRNEGKEFIGFYQNQGLEDLGKRVRLYHLFPHKFRDNKGLYSLFTRAIRFMSIRLQILLFIKRNAGITMWKGTQWISVTQEFAEFILSERDNILKRFRYTYGCDEFFIQTCCMNSQFNNSVYCMDDEGKGSLRAIRWKDNAIYDWGNEDFTMLKESEMLFARKFSEDNIEVVQRLSQYVKNSDN